MQLVRSTDEPISKLANELGFSHQTLRNWVHQSDVVVGTPSDRIQAALAMR